MLGDRLLELLAQLGPVDGDRRDAFLVEPEHDLALERIRRVVEVHDRPRRPLEAFVGALDQLLAALDEHLDVDVVGDQVLLDQLAYEVEVGLARRREADLDLLEAHLHQLLEHPQLAGRIHRVDERLVAVAEVDRAPPWGAVDHDVGPGPVGRVTTGMNGRYFSKGIFLGVTLAGGMWVSFGSSVWTVRSRPEK